jgi:hypothetical protein
MLPHSALSFAAILLVAGPAPAPAPDRVPRSDAEKLAMQLGHSVGAAKECALGERADAAMAKAIRMVHQAAEAENMDTLDMNDRLHDAMQEGREAILNRTMSCEQARTDLKRLEGERSY